MSAVAQHTVRRSDAFLRDMLAHLSAKANRLADQILVEPDLFLGNALLDELTEVVDEHKLVASMLLVAA